MSETRTISSVSVNGAEPHLSIVVPVFNEAESLDPLVTAITEAIPSHFSYEILFIDDGSTDASWKTLLRLGQENKAIRLIRFRRNFGQTAALAAGFQHSRGEIVIPLDADLQNDPCDIPALLQKLAEGFDVVSGWRKDREDPFLTRRLPSQLANGLISRWTGVRLHDYGCTLKAYRRSILSDIRLYGEMHRFLPYLAWMAGARIAEIPVRHHPRRYGKSHYGLGRSLKVALDLLTLRFLGRYAAKPSYLFGAIGLASISAGILVAAYTLYDRFANHVFVHRNPLILLACVFALAGTQFLAIGLLAEILLRTYHESQDKPTYIIGETQPPAFTGDLPNSPRNRLAS